MNLLYLNYDYVSECEQLESFCVFRVLVEFFVVFVNYANAFQQFHFVLNNTIV